MSPLRWHLIIVDDRNYFALRVWRYVSRTVGIQMENSTSLSAGLSAGWPPDGKPLLSDDGEVCFWWVEANGDAIRTLQQFLDKDNAPSLLGIFVLVDVKGEGTRYSADNVCGVLEKIRKARGASSDIFRWEVVSSYPSIERIGDKPVRRKSIETLRIVRQAIYPKDPDASPGTALGSDPEVAHILVTGAGFEVADESRGGFGMPHTRKILKNMGPPFRLLDRNGKVIHAPDASVPEDALIDLKEFFYQDKGKEEEGFPVPSGFAWDGQLRNALEIRSQRGELDLYWDIILEENLRRRLGAANTEVRLGIRDQEKAIALHRERRIREAFRKSLVDHDWGYMNQSLVAARLGWHAWLTTNYTKFADRAVSLADSFRRNGQRSIPWRIISTASEANISVREDTGNTTEVQESVRSEQDGRYLFKLHGDIAHLHTMAIAGHDKDLFNPLCVPVESLYQIYAAAERFLRNSLWNMKVKQVIWHIVGHGLQDIRLFRLIQAVCSHSAEGVSHTFVIVNPAAEGPAEALEPLFKEGPKQVDRSKVEIVKVKLFASQYMARLGRTELTWFDKWLKANENLDDKERSEALAKQFKDEFEPEEDLGEMPRPPKAAPAGLPTTSPAA